MVKKMKPTSHLLSDICISAHKSSKRDHEVFAASLALQIEKELANKDDPTSSQRAAACRRQREEHLSSASALDTEIRRLESLNS